MAQNLSSIFFHIARTIRTKSAILKSSTRRALCVNVGQGKKNALVGVIRNFRPIVGDAFCNFDDASVIGGNIRAINFFSIKTSLFLQDFDFAPKLPLFTAYYAILQGNNFVFRQKTTFSPKYSAQGK